MRHAVDSTRSFDWFLIAIGTFVISIASCASNVNADQQPSARLSAFAATDNDNELLVSDSSRGRLFRVNVRDRIVVAEMECGEGLVDLCRLSADRFVAIDQDLRQLIALSLNENDCKVFKRVSLDLDPCRVAVSEDTQVACISGRWSQSAQVLAWSDRDKVIRRPAIQLGFEACEILPLSAHRFLVADAFAGQLAVIDADKNKIVARKRIHGHNIRGLALSSDRANVLIAHQVLSRVARSDFDDVHWGSLMQNAVSRVPIPALLDPHDDLRHSRRTIALGDTGNGFADPTGVLGVSGGFMVLSGGARQLLLYQNGKVVRRLPTGARPTNILQLSSGKIVILNEHDASLSVTTWIDDTTPATIQVSTRSSLSSGEMAFFDGRLSHDSWMTCNSCHIDGHSPGLSADTFGDGAFGNPKRIPSLLGAGGTAPFGWTGNKKDLRQQILTTLASTMHVGEINEKTTDSLVQYVRQLQLPPVAGSSDKPAVTAGRLLFEQHKCSQCHGGPTFTSPVIRDVGVRDELGTREFNPPSIRRLKYRRSYLHDGRARSLEGVFGEHHHPRPHQLTTEQIKQLVAYLGTL